MSNKLEEAELIVSALTRRDFKKEIGHFDEMFELFLETFHFLSKNAPLNEEEYIEWSGFLLFIRIFRVIRSAYKCMMYGYYDVAMALLRMAFENHLLMFYLSDRKDEAKQWFQGKRFTPRFLKKEVKKPRYDEPYSMWSDFVHTDFKTIHWFLKEQGKGSIVSVAEQDPLQFCIVTHGLLAVGKATLALIVYPFKQVFDRQPLKKRLLNFYKNERIMKQVSKKIEEFQKHER